MTEVIGTGTQMVNAEYVAKFAAKNEDAPRIATTPTNVSTDVRRFQMEMATVM